MREEAARNGKKRAPLPRLPFFEVLIIKTKKKGQSDFLTLTCSFNGANGRTRTGDLRITSALLYHLSHVGLCW